jgi:hypothetical protein
MLELTEERFGLKPQWLTADRAYGSANAELVGRGESDHAAHPFSREDFRYGRTHGITFSVRAGS